MRFGLLALSALLVAGCSGKQPSPSPAPRTSQSSDAPASPSGPQEPRRPQQGSRIESYSKVIPERAISDEGLFKTHIVDGKLFFEIPRSELGKEMLLVATIAKNTGGKFGGAPVGNRVLRWERRGDKILLRSPSYEVVADSTHPIYRAVEAATFAPIVASFDIKAWGPDSAAVIEVTSLYTTKSPEFGTNHSGSIDKDRTFVERAAAYPENVEVSATHTYTVTPTPPQGTPAARRPSPRSESIVVHWSMVKLPEVPMEPRIFDSRVGYFTVGKVDYGTDEHRASQYRYITRWRLECKPGENIPCEPVKPIVFHIDPATPPQWVPYIKQGVEDWQVAFEEAGFKNAILAKDAPTDDPKWSPEDARYSMIRWMPSTVENARGPHVHDPRTGEILVSDIEMYHNVLNLLRNWYFAQVGPLDPRAQRFPFPDSFMGRLLRYVVAHEVGHTLGLQHNMKASSMYPADSLRNVDFLRRMRHVSSIMDYARFNYVAQPEDSIPPELLIPDIGPYDKFAIRWGYRPIPGVKSAAEARPVLDEWAREQDEKPWLRFSTTDGGGVVVGEQTEAVGDADPVYSTGLGLKNIRRLIPLLIPATVREGEDFSDLKEAFRAVLGQWALELNHVVELVGGVEGQEKFGGQKGVRFEPLPAKRQREAVAFLNREAFSTPDYFLDQKVLRRIEPAGALQRISGAQARTLASLLKNDRLQRLIEFEALALRGTEVYSLAELLRDVRRGVWSELSGGSAIRINALRRNLQNAYLDEVDSKLNPAPNTRDLVPMDARALLRRELGALDATIRVALPRAGDEVTRAHLELVRVRIKRILEPRA